MFELGFELGLIVQLDQVRGSIQIQIGIHELSSDRVQPETRRRARRVKRELTPQGVFEQCAQSNPALGRILFCVFQQGIGKRNRGPHIARIASVCVNIKA